MGNEAGTLFTIPWPGGKVVFTPDGPGSIEPDGSLGVKWPWYRTVPGYICISVRRLDGPAPRPAPVILRGPEDGYGETGFHPSGLTFSSPDCWEVTAKVGEERLTFVTLAVGYGFDPPQFVEWPSGVPYPSEFDLGGWPEVIRQVPPAGSSEGLVVETARTASVQADSRPARNRESLAESRFRASCVRGAPAEGGAWNAQADRVVLEWEHGNLTNRLIAGRGSGLSCADLLRIARSQQ